MKRKRYSVEQIIGKLRDAEVLLSQGRTVKEVSRGLGVTEQTYYRCRKEYGGLKVAQKQPKRGRLWLNDGSCVRLRPTHRHHVWSYDFVQDCTHDGRPIKMLTVIDEFSRESLAILVERRLNADDVLHCLADLFINHGAPEHIRSDNGPEFTAHAVRHWLERTGVRTLFIEPGSPWENGHWESFNGKLRDELLDREIFSTLKEAQVLIERWRIEYNTFRPHSSLGYRPPAPEASFKTFIVQHTQEMISSPGKARTLKTLT